MMLVLHEEFFIRFLTRFLKSYQNKCFTKNLYVYSICRMKKCMKNLTKKSYNKSYEKSHEKSLLLAVNFLKSYQSLVTFLVAEPIRNRELYVGQVMTCRLYFSDVINSYL